MFITVIIPARNCADTIEEQLAALAAQTHVGPFEVVVADNGSGDDTAEVARRWAGRLPDLRVVDAGGRAGINHARNAGAAAARGDYLLFCDADDVVEPGWLEAMAAAAATCDAVGGRLDRTSINETDAIAVRGHAEMDGLPIRGDFLPRPVGANCGVRTEIWRALGGFNEEYIVGGTETEFFWRVQLASHGLCYVGDAVVHYRVRPDTRGTMKQFYRYGRQRPRLYRDFRAHGMPRSPARQWTRRMGWLVVHLPDLVAGAPRRGVWLRRAAGQAGRIVGSVRHRVLYF